MTFEERIILIRKQIGWSQADLAIQIDSSRIMIGKYERVDNSQSIDVLLRLAKALDISVDFILDEGANASYDKEMIKRIEDVESLPADEKKRIFHYIDLIIRDHKTSQACAN